MLLFECQPVWTDDGRHSWKPLKDCPRPEGGAMRNGTYMMLLSPMAGGGRGSGPLSFLKCGAGNWANAYGATGQSPAHSLRRT